MIHSPSFQVTGNSILSFWYHMNGNGIGSLNVYLVSKGTRHRLWQKTGRQSPDWLLATIPISSGSYQIELEATAKYHYGSDLAVDDITFRKALSSLQLTTPPSSPTTVKIAALPINCNFEDGLCGFKTDNSNFSSASWTRKSGTESLGNFTFLRGDNTTGSGSYLSLTIANKRALIADRASLYIPAIRSQKMTCLTFAYSLPSNTSGVIQIFQTGANTGTATLMKQLSGYHGPHWKSSFVQFLPSFEPLKVVIEGYYSGEPGCVVTIDDIHFVEGICDEYDKSTTRAATTITIPTTKTSPAMFFNKTSSCHSEYFGLLSALSCDFTSDFCNYTTINSPVHWQRKKGAGGNRWLSKIPERKNTLSGYYLTLNVSTYLVRHGDGILKTPEINLTSVCLEFSYSLPGTSSGIKVEKETSLGHVKTIWQKSGITNSGKWSTKALVINSLDRYKASTNSYKNSSLSYVGIDDIHIYGKLETSTSSSAGATAFVTNLTTPKTKITDWITASRLKTTITHATKPITEKSTEHMLVQTTVQQTHISTNSNLYRKIFFIQ
ncbi:unnamed protein product [Mytilus coruscus]|uniref:MAM domain-containing protein n=1 Tax=Mytilus coruscus TaxID=42192 RepID=A0A6J8C1A1_MYTCO|nr:unnamed protein product [Mytilus coruscus]